MRQYIANIFIFPDVTSKAEDICAYTKGSWLSTSYAPGCFSLGVIAHETTHILDVAALTSVIAADGLPAGTSYSSTAHWSGAFNKDADVPTSYANTNSAEDFAETGRISVSEFVHPGILASTNSEVTLISNQLGNYAARLQSIINPTGGKCTGKADTSEAVMMSTGATRRSIRSAPPPPSTLIGSGVPEILKPENVTATWFHKASEVSKV